MTREWLIYYAVVAATHAVAFCIGWFLRGLRDRDQQRKPTVTLFSTTHTSSDQYYK